MEFLNLLSREEMKNVKGGADCEDMFGTCECSLLVGCYGQLCPNSGNYSACMQSIQESMLLCPALEARPQCTGVQT
ncbi:MAG: hypothetical protein ABJH08_06280 [Balneola sp.]